MQHLALVSVVVPDYDDAIEYYVSRLGFQLVADTPAEDGKRWVVVRPTSSGSCGLLLARAHGEAQVARVGDQTGGRVFLFLHTDQFDRDYAQLKLNGVAFSEQPRDEPYGRVAVFEDLYGNRWDLIEPISDS